MSMLFWVEHCVECAAPDCYRSCDLYSPRKDKRCRRLTFGAMKNRNFASLRSYGVEVAFKKWAKLEAYGNLALFPSQAVIWAEKFVEQIAPASNATGALFEKLTGKTRWSSATLIALEEMVRRLDAKRSEQQVPDAFLLEVYNPAAEAVKLQLSFTGYTNDEAAGKPLPVRGASYITTVALPEGYSRHEIEFSRLTFVTGPRRPFLISMVPEADSYAHLVFLSADFVQYAPRPAFSRASAGIKCVVWDLDNTLWSGILAEETDSTPHPEAVSLVKRLDERGIINSIASKNDHGAAWRKLEHNGLSDYFVAPQIGWAPKSQGIRAIARQLNLGLDSFAFIDDSAFELDEVHSGLPEVLCIHARDLASLFSNPRFQGGATAESRGRRKLYQDAIAREQAQTQFGSDYVGFLADCGIVLEISAYSDADAERVAELVQRTNQLNFSGRKYTRAELEKALAVPSTEKLVIRGSDRYGSYGTVGFALVERAEGTIRILDFMLSCRVQGKLFEQAFFAHLVEHHNPGAFGRLWVNFQETQRNKPARQVLDSLGFRICQDTCGDRDAGGMVCDSASSVRCDFIEVHCSAGPTASAGIRTESASARNAVAGR